MAAAAQPSQTPSRSLQTISKCSVESCSNTATKRCSACHITPYCGVPCQTRDWPTHRTVCRPLSISVKEEEKKEKARGEVIEPTGKNLSRSPSATLVEKARNYVKNNEGPIHEVIAYLPGMTPSDQQAFLKELSVHPQWKTTDMACALGVSGFENEANAIMREISSPGEHRKFQAIVGPVLRLKERVSQLFPQLNYRK